MSRGSCWTRWRERRMDKWPRTVLGDVLKIEHGYAFKGKYFDPAGSRILLTPKNFKASGGLDLSESRCKFYEGPVEKRFELDSGDVVVAMTDLKQDAPILGSAGTVPEGERYLHNQRIGKVKIRDEDRLDRRFAPWLLNSPVVREAVRSSATGSTVRHTAPTRIEAVAVPLPPIHIQRRIAATLSAFDELVAVNQRRMELLEDLARSLALPRVVRALPVSRPHRWGSSRIGCWPDSQRLVAEPYEGFCGSCRRWR